VSEEVELLAQRVKTLGTRVSALESRANTDETLRETEEESNRRTRRTIDAHTTHLESIVATQAQHTERLDSIDGRLGRMENVLIQLLDRLPPKP
jgi:hypothetical protein